MAEPIIELGGNTEIDEDSNGNLVLRHVSSGETITLSGNGASTGQLYTTRDFDYVIGEIDGTLYAIGATEAASGTFADLQGALDHATTNGDSVAVTAGAYPYSTTPIIPTRTHVHFENVTLEPDGCVGLQFGDGTNAHTQQVLTGSIHIKPTQGTTAATRGLYIYGAKLLQVRGQIRLDSGFSTAALDINGGDTGSWWNGYQGLHVRGATNIHTTGTSQANAQAFVHSLFRGQLSINGNGHQWRNCWLEDIDGGETVEIDGADNVIDARAERVDINLNNATRNAISIRRGSSVTITRNFTVGGANTGNEYFIRHPDGRIESEVAEHDATTRQIINNYAQTAGDSNALLDLRHTYSASGNTNVIRTEGARFDGYHLLCVWRGSNVARITPQGGFQSVPRDLSTETGNYDREMRYHDGADGNPEGLYRWDATNAIWELERDNGTTTI